MVSFNLSWFSVVFGCCPWFSGCKPLFSSVFYGFLQFSMVFLSFSLFSVICGCLPRLSGDFPWFSTVYHRFLQFFMVFFSFHGFVSFSWLSSVFLVFYGFWVVFHGFLQCFVVFFSLSLIFLGFRAAGGGGGSATWEFSPHNPVFLWESVPKFVCMFHF